MISAIALAGLIAAGYWGYTEWGRTYTARREELGYTVAKPPDSRQRSGMISLVIFAVETVYLFTIF